MPAAKFLPVPAPEQPHIRRSYIHSRDLRTPSTTARGSGIADAESLSRHTVNVCSSAGCSIKGNVTYNNILVRFEPCTVGRAHNQFSAGKTFSEIIVAVACKFQRQSSGDKCAKALSACALAFDHKTVVLQTFRISLRNLGSEDCSKRTVCIGNVNFQASLLSLLQRRISSFLTSTFSSSVFSSSKSNRFFGSNDHAFLFFCVRIVKYAAQIKGCRPV